MGASTTGPQRSNLTHVNGVPVTSSAGKPYAVGVIATIKGTVSFGSTDTQHDSSLAGLGAASVNEIEIDFYGPQFVLDSGLLSGGGRRWEVSWEVLNTTTIRFYKIDHDGGGNSGDLLPSTHRFNARRVVLP